MRGTTSIYERLINDLPILVAKAFIAKVQFEPISAIFLLSRFVNTAAVKTGKVLHLAQRIRSWFRIDLGQRQDARHVTV